MQSLTKKEIGLLVETVLASQSFACFAVLEPSDRKEVLARLADDEIKFKKTNILKWITDDKSVNDIFQPLTKEEFNQVMSTLVDRVALYEYLTNNIIKMISTLSENNREMLLPEIQKKIAYQRSLLPDESHTAIVGEQSLKQVIPILYAIDRRLGDEMASHSADAMKKDDSTLLQGLQQANELWLKDVMLKVGNSPDHYIFVPLLLDFPDLNKYLIKTTDIPDGGVLKQVLKLAGSAEKISGFLKNNESAVDAMINGSPTDPVFRTFVVYLQEREPSRLQEILSQISDSLLSEKKSSKTVDTVFSGIMTIDFNLVQYVPSKNVCACFQYGNKRDWNDIWSALTQTCDSSRLRDIINGIDVQDNDRDAAEKNLILMGHFIYNTDENIARSFIHSSSNQQLQAFINKENDLKTLNAIIKRSDKFLLSQSDAVLIPFIAGNHSSIDMDSKRKVMRVLEEQAPERFPSVVTAVGNDLSDKFEKPKLKEETKKKYIRIVVENPSLIPRLRDATIVTIMNFDHIEPPDKLAILSGLKNESEERLQVINTAMLAAGIDMKPYTAFFPLETGEVSPLHPASPISPASYTSTIPAEFSPRSPESPDWATKFREDIAEFRRGGSPEVIESPAQKGPSSK